MLSWNAHATITRDRTSSMLQDLERLTHKRVLVGVPEEKDDFKTPKAMKEERTIGNAALAYIHDNGSPLQGIPARPFMEPGVANAKDKIDIELLAGIQDSLDGKVEEMERRLMRAGLIAQNSIKGIIREATDFEPLKQGTLTGRLRQRKNYKKMKEERKQELRDSMTPLRNTSSMLNAITFILEDVS